MYRYPTNGTKHTHTYGDVLKRSKTETPPTNVRTNDHYIPAATPHPHQHKIAQTIVRSIGTTTPKV